MGSNERKQLQDSVPLPAKCLNCKKDPRQQLGCEYVVELSFKQANDPNLHCGNVGNTIGLNNNGVISRTGEFNKRGFRDDWPPLVKQQARPRERGLL